MFELNIKRLAGIYNKINPDCLVSHFSGNAENSRFNTAILRPGEAIETKEASLTLHPGDLLDTAGGIVRHDSTKLASLLNKVMS